MYIYACIAKTWRLKNIYIYMYIYIIFLFRFFSIIGYYKVFGIAPSAIQWALVGYLKVKVLVA